MNIPLQCARKSKAFERHFILVAKHGKMNRNCAAFSSTSSQHDGRRNLASIHTKKQQIGQPMKRNKSDKVRIRRGRGENKSKSKPAVSKNDDNVKSTLSKCNEIMSKLLLRRQEFPSPPIDWLHSSENFQDDENHAISEDRINLYNDVLSLIQVVELSIQAKRIQASSGKDIRELTALLGNILLLCSESPPERLTSSTLPSPSESCTKVLSLLNKLNLDVQNIHNFCTIRAANQEHEWELASSLFRNQIDPDLNGLVPVDPSLGWNTFLEMGLYGLAMNLSEHDCEDVDIVEGLLAAVSDMVMVSPTDKEKYVMAAGSALGRAGLGKSCVAYLSIHPQNNEFGQPLFAAMMNACFICEKYDAVLDLYYNMQQDSESISGDWQWEGEFARSHPLCTDLLLKSVGMLLQNSVDMYQSFSEGSILVFEQIIEEDGRISLDAIKGILLACENDANYEGAIKVLRHLQNYEESKCEWKIVADSTENFLYEEDSVDKVEKTQIIDEEVLATVMNTCCLAEEYGLALLFMRAKSYPDITPTYDDSVHDTMVEKLLANQPMLYHSTRLLNSTIVALEGLRCSKDAGILYSKVKSTYGETLEAWEPNDSDQINRWWREAYHHTDRLLFASESLKHTSQNITKEDEYNLSLGTALMLKCAIESGEVNAGIEVCNIMASLVNQKSKKSMKDTVKSFLGIEGENVGSNKNFCYSSDELFSATITARKIKYGVEDALNMFSSEWDPKNLENDNTKTQKGPWIITANTYLDLLLEKGDIDKADDFFKRLSRKSRTAGSYLIMAKGYKNSERWNEVAACYNAAKLDGCLTEEMCFLAMEGIAESTIDGKVKILRSVATEVSNMKGIKSGAWIADNYWDLKRRLGFHYARLLMWWNDPNETQQQEFRLASQYLDTPNKSKAAIDLDVLKTIIQLARYQHLSEKKGSNKHDNQILHPPSLVLRSMFELHEGNQDESSEQLLLEGMKYLSQTKSTAECVKYLQYIESSNHINVHEELLYLAKKEVNESISRKSIL